MKEFKGRRFDEGCSVTVVVDGRVRPLNPRFDIRKHSPDGFNWAYGGSGPAQLALALCCEVLQDDDRAHAVYQKFKWLVIAQLSGDEWVLTEEQIKLHVEHIETSDGKVH